MPRHWSRAQPGDILHHRDVNRERRALFEAFGLNGIRVWWQRGRMVVDGGAVSGRPWDFQVSQTGSLELTIGPGWYGAFHSSKAQQGDARRFAVASSGWLVAKWTYATTAGGTGSFATANDADGNASVVYPAASVSNSSDTELFIPIQKYTVTGGKLEELPPQSWCGGLFIFDRHICPT